MGSSFLRTLIAPGTQSNSSTADPTSRSTTTSPNTQFSRRWRSTISSTRPRLAKTEIETSRLVIELSALPGRTTILLLEKTTLPEKRSRKIPGMSLALRAKSKSPERCTRTDTWRTWFTASGMSIKESWMPLKLLTHLRATITNRTSISRLLFLLLSLNLLRTTLKLNTILISTNSPTWSFDSFYFFFSVF